MAAVIFQILGVLWFVTHCVLDIPRNRLGRRIGYAASIRQATDCLIGSAMQYDGRPGARLRHRAGRIERLPIVQHAAESKFSGCKFS